MSEARVAFITGAGRGIGKAMALAFGRDGYCVVVGSPTASRNEAVASAIREAGAEALAVTLDVADEVSVRRAMQVTREQFGCLDVLVNNAGIKPESVPREHQNVVDMQADVWRRMHEVNVYGTFLCCREAARLMLERGGGSIINISSGAGVVPQAGRSAYNSSKAAVNMLTRVLALELQECSVLVNAVNPGFTATEETHFDQLSPRQRQSIVRTETSLPLVLFLARSDQHQLTGQVLDAVEWNAANGFGGRETWSLFA
jgi:NAD(P)-dependent dehydrogenase (short-subunit alcohol dehydrogenase family)